MAESPSRPPHRVPGMRPDPIIVMGAPRSGTTYVNEILNQHPDVFVTHETRVFVWMHRTMVEGLSHPQRFLSHRDRFEGHLARQLPDVVRSFYGELRPGAVHWGDKNPHYASPDHAGVLPMIRDLFPGSKFIHVYRDGRDVVASLLRKRFPDGRPWVDFEGAHELWNGHVVTGREFGREIAGSRFLEIRYEELVADDVAWARTLFDFLQIDFAPEVEAFCAAQREERTPFSGPTRRLGASADGSDWGDLLGPDQRRRSLAALRANLVRFGYETEEHLAQVTRPTPGPGG